MNTIKDLPYRKGVGIMLFNKEKKIFVGKRLDNQSAWQMPQGGVDGDENVLETAKRELQEETGITSIQIIKQSKKQYTYDLPESARERIWKGKFKGQEQTWFLVKFLGEDKEINLQQKYPEFKDWKWVLIEELENLIVPFKKDLYQEITKEFKSFI